MENTFTPEDHRANPHHMSNISPSDAPKGNNDNVLYCRLPIGYWHIRVQH